MRAFNAAYYYAGFREKVERTLHYEPFFYPLDAVADWNRMYGKRGFLQYQCVVPEEKDGAGVREFFERIAASRLRPTLAVLKVFGSVRSPGILSFPRPGVTLALDFPYRGEATLRLCEGLDEVVRKAQGGVYPAKDARMSAESFQRYFPQWKHFARFLDARFSSSFWRRVTGPIDGGRHS